MNLERLYQLAATGSHGKGGPFDIIDNLFRSQSRVLGADSTFVTTDGASLIATQYEINMAAGLALIGGVFADVAALSDQPIVGTDAWAKSWTLAGAAPAALADGDSYEMALVLILVANAPELHAVFGAPADTGDEVAPTYAEIKTALRLAGIADYLNTPPLVVERINFARSGASITATHGAPSSNDALKQERLMAGM